MTTHVTWRVANPTPLFPGKLALRVSSALHPPTRTNISMSALYIVCEVSRKEEMDFRGTEAESCITEYTLVYKKTLRISAEKWLRCRLTSLACAPGSVADIEGCRRNSHVTGAGREKSGVPGDPEGSGSLSGLPPRPKGNRGSELDHSLRCGLGSHACFRVSGQIGSL